MRTMVCAAAFAATTATAGVAAASPPDPARRPLTIAVDPNHVPDNQIVAPQPIADPVAPPPRQPMAAIIGVAGGGIVGAKDIHGSAYVARFELDAFPEFAPAARPGGVAGFGYGFEYWRAGPDNWGFALPAGVDFGARVGAAHATIGLGIEMLVVDQIEDDTGVGSGSYADAQLGLHLGKYTAVIDGRIDHRWLAGAANRTQWSLGVMFGVTDETHPRF